MSVKGHSVIIEHGNQSTHEASTVWTAVAELVDITPPNVEADDIETSHMLTPEQFKTFDPGWADGGEVEFTVQYEKAKNATLYGLFRQPKGYRVLFADAPGPSGSRWKFNGHVKGFSNEVDREGLITADITIKISGKPVFEPAA
jgi:hypothetical protein